MSRLTPQLHPTLNKLHVEALHTQRIFTVAHFIDQEAKLLAKITRLTFKEIIDIKRVFLKAHSATPKNGFSCYNNSLSNTAIISTGIKSLDKLLEGGFLTGNIYELCGFPASGKSHLVHAVLKNVILQINQSVFLLDTKNDFSVGKLVNMLDLQNEDLLVSCLGKLLVKSPATKYELINSLHEIKSDLNSDKLQLRLIVIDSLAALFLNSQDYHKSNASLNHLANVMRFIAKEQHVAFLITNLVTKWSNTDFKNVQESKETIACGKYWRTIPNTTLKIEKNDVLCNISICKSDTIKNTTDTVTVMINKFGFEKCS